jgi:hypothetical protein
VAVDDADTAGGSHDGTVQELIHVIPGFFGALADHVDLLVQRGQRGRGFVADASKELPRKLLITINWLETQKTPI